MDMVSKVSGSWKVQTLGGTLNFVLTNGKLTIDGKPFQLTPSGNKDYPAGDGWFEYTPNSYIKISETDIKVVALAGTELLPLTVTKNMRFRNSTYLFTMLLNGECTDDNGILLSCVHSTSIVITLRTNLKKKAVHLPCNT